MTIPFDHMSPGLYWINQRSQKKGIDHHAILDIGNRTGYRSPIPGHAVIIHQTPPRITREPAAGTGYWNVMMKIDDEKAATQRLIAASANPVYSTAANNCEHFSRYVATGVRQSHQLQRAGFIAAIIGLVLASS